MSEQIIKARIQDGELDEYQQGRQDEAIYQEHIRHDYEDQLTAARADAEMLAQALRKMRELAQSEYFMPEWPFDKTLEALECDAALSAHAALKEGK